PSYSRRARRLASAPETSVRGAIVFVFRSRSFTEERLMKVGGVSGAWGERAAAAHAEAAGARVIDRNVRGAQGEIDLVLEHGGGYAFGEVKARRRHALETGLGAVGRTKQQ